MSDKLNGCPFCKQPAMSYTVNMTFKGCCQRLWVTECDCMEDIKELPYVEHQLSVYGETKEQSQERWQELTSIFKRNSGESNERN